MLHIPHITYQSLSELFYTNLLLDLQSTPVVNLEENAVYQRNIKLDTSKFIKKMILQIMYKINPLYNYCPKQICTSTVPKMVACPSQTCHHFRN